MRRWQPSPVPIAPQATDNAITQALVTRAPQSRAIILAGRDADGTAWLTTVGRATTDELGQDHPGVAPGAEQRRPGHGGHDLVPAYVINRRIRRGRGQAVQLLENGAQGEDHVVAGIAVRHREDIEVIDLLAASVQRGQRCFDDGTKTNDAGVGHESGKPR